MVEVPKYAELQKIAGPLFLASLGLWLLPLPPPLPEYRAWGAGACLLSGSILLWSFGGWCSGVVAEKRKAALEQKEYQAQEAQKHAAILEVVRAMPPDERGVVLQVYQTQTGKLELPSTSPEVVRLHRAGVLQYLCPGQFAPNAAVYTLHSAVRRMLDAAQGRETLENAEDERSE